MPALRRVDFGYFVRPREETGTGSARVEPCLGYVIDHPDGAVLFDTGMGSDPDVDAHYRPARRPLPVALSYAGIAVDEVTVVVNSHLHFDHCGGNPELSGTPILAQRAELAAARVEGYTLPQLVDAPGLRYEPLDGEAEIRTGLHVVPTPGHSPGHQSLVYRLPDGTVVVAGQCHDNASAYGSDALAWRTRHDEHRPAVPTAAWMGRLEAFDPRRVVFAHDYAVWEP